MIEYVFFDECVKNAFENCISVLFNELTTEQAFRLNQQTQYKKIVDSEYECANEDFAITEFNLKNVIDEFFEDFNIEIDELFLNSEDLEKQCNLIDDEHTHVSITIEKESQLDVLFCVHYSQKQSIEKIEYEEFERLKFDQFDYSKLYSKIDNKFEELSKKYHVTNVEIDSDSNYDYIDFKCKQYNL